MDPRLLKYYNTELHHLREMGGEFAAEFPKIAARLGMDSFECADPYVERLLEGFAFLAARVQLKLDAEFPRFTQHLLEMIYPNYLEPTPSMTVVQFQPDLAEGSLNEGFAIERGTALRSQTGKGEQTPCEYRTAHEVKLWPLQITQAEYLPNLGAVSNLGVPSLKGVKAALRLRLKTSAGLKFNGLALDSLPVFLRGHGELPMQLYEQLIGDSLAVCMQSTEKPYTWQHLVKENAISRLGFSDDEALLNYSPRSFQGYRLLQEYFAFPERFMFVGLNGFADAVNHCDAQEMDVIVLLKRSHAKLISAVDSSQFALFCTPAINLFPKHADPIHIDQKLSEFHVIPDRSRPMDFEVCQIKEVIGTGEGDATEKREFQPFYQYSDERNHDSSPAYYSLYRQQRVASSKQKRQGPRSSYIGNEIFIALVDGQSAPYSKGLKQLSIKTLCSNRDLPLQMPLGGGKTDFTMQKGAPVNSIRCLSGPTKPRASNAYSNANWSLINHLSLNYLSLIDRNAQEGATALRSLLRLYSEYNVAAITNQIEGLSSIQANAIVRRINTAGPIVFGRGLEITLNFDESAFEGSGVFLMGAVLENFLARYISINSFTETVVQSSDRGEIIRWPARMGRRKMI
ncbi:MAG: type VI secretion system baseplate subunit TssF [Methylicorpusculum sp.]|uniref:type VI secretion system baseplate subunit TssF n=1 Tax=Methylicorpusculum sp. TaxID=2713644 RepID=UPI002720998A|nr:type VI secretion system baseplate subunit TssF [Methylicorpusculum sp.]MDO8843645.1 type VI secretion system baseplate subunit TssF [Methylicorpusculum sp.]MDO8939964.1 type VI secretion system baseplate subunit TssF [Methylicorpusculum sp.]MDP2203007.1 type VI secretion system baseplate subunit TssF [Methylicorpusculum sp.]